MIEFLHHISTGIMVGGIYGLIALGFVLIWKSSRILNFAQGDMLVLTAAVCWFLLVELSVSPWLSILLTLTFAVLLGVATERLTLRPLVGQPILALMMVPIALSAAFRGFALFILGRTGRTVEILHPELLPSGHTVIGDISLSTEFVWGFAIVLILIVCFALFFRYTRIGLLMRATAEGHQLAQSKGINVNTVIALSWVASGIVAAVGGVVVGSMMGISLGLSMIGLKAIPAALIGGMESIPGAILGGIILGIVEALVKGYVGLGLGDAAAFMVLVFVLLVKPYGLFGLETIERV